MISKILVPVRGDDKGEIILAHALVLGVRYGAHVQVAHCRPRPEDLTPFGVPITAFLREQFAKRAVEVADTAADKLRKM